MNYIQRLKILENFKCLGTTCPQNCCTNWNLSLHPLDIEYYKKKPQVLGELRTNFDFKKKVIKCIEGRCSNLDNESLCALQKQSTHKALPLICKQFPRIMIKQKQNHIYIASISCPEIVNQLYSTTTELLHSPKKI